MDTLTENSPSAGNGYSMSGGAVHLVVADTTDAIARASTAGAFPCPIYTSGRIHGDCHQCIRSSRPRSSAASLVPQPTGRGTVFTGIVSTGQIR